MDDTPTPTAAPTPIPEPQADRPPDDVPVVTPPSPVPSVPPPAPTPKVSTPIIVAIVVTALVISGVFYGLSRINRKEVAVAPTPTPTAIATPTPIRQPSALAGTPEFMLFSDAVATLSAAIAGYSPQDPSLTPPTLVLPLGFSQN